MKGLVTDRTERNVYYRKTLSKKGWNRMTSVERAEWLGDPMVTPGANLLPQGPYYSSAVALKYKSGEIVATATGSGIYLYAISIVGEASKFEGKTLTLSLDGIIPSGSGDPMVSAYWHGASGFEFAGGSLITAGTVTFDTTSFPNTAGREYLALYIYPTTSVSVTAGASARFVGLMLEFGSVRHPYTPYTEIVPTQATKGAYNYADLNRVERAVAEISEMASLGLITKTDWGMWDVPTVAEMNRFLSNIAAIRALLPEDTEEAEETEETEGTEIPAAPLTMNNLSYVEANNIEKILEAAFALLTG